MYVKHNDPNIAPIVKVAFPSNKKDIKVKEFQGPINVNSYWDGGSKDEYRLVDLINHKSIPFPTSHPFFDTKQNGERCGSLVIKELPENTALVCGGIFCGKPMGVRVLLRPDNLVKMLPVSPKITDEQREVLSVIRSIKGGYRQDEFNRRNLGKYSPENPIIADLTRLGFVKINKAGSISVTTEGKNI